MTKEFIRTSGLKGFRKSKFEVAVESPEGKRRIVLAGELSHIERDKRKQERKDYVTLCSLKGSHRGDLTYNLATNRLSITYHLGVHHGWTLLDDEATVKLIAAMSLLSLRQRGIFSKILEGQGFEHKIAARFFMQQFRQRIRDGRTAWFRSAKARRAHRR